MKDPASLIRALVLLALIALVAAFAAFVWPTRWRYDHMTVDGDIVPVRIDRFTGDADMLVPDSGWLPVESAPDSTPGQTAGRTG